MKTSGLIGLLLVLIAALSAWIWPEALLSPGPLSPAHQKETTSCLDCHSPQGMGAACVDCHRPEQIKVKPSVARFHSKTTAGECLDCHGEHGAQKTAKFSHQGLPAGLSADCAGCHQAPKDKDHAQAPPNCAACHGTRSFTPVEVDHQALGSALCVDCHLAPKDRLHKPASQVCRDCHGTTSFKPARFDHDRWFRFDRDHGPECADCHRGESYDQYTCTACHEHSPRKLRGEHREEGIFDLKDCADCHRSGDEHQARRRRESGALGTGVGAYPKGGSYRRYDDEHHDEHDDDDDH